ncbi:MAG TPA: tetratricopeptide repeat protein [Opitutaceae bacterium]|jgi:predicted O-linked N-acetylglucosamine transferase (SPINDLY family)|nr:tetratricopeptide repeat protein [Opitutaceae bacterium]
MTTSAETLKRGGERHAAGDLAGARAHYLQVLGAEPKSAQALFLLGIVEMQEGKLDAALWRIEQAIAAAPEVTRYWYGCGEVLTRLGRFADAAAAYRRILAAEPAMAEAHYALGVALQSQGDPGGAAAAFLEALRLRPEYRNDAGYSVNLGLAYCDLRQFAEAVAMLEQATRLNPQLPEAAFNLANALAGAGRTLEAAEWYVRAITLRPNYGAAFNNLGNVLRQEGEFKAALEAFEQAERAEPESTAPANNLAGLYRRLGRLDEAETVLERALKAHPGSAATLSNLGNVRKENADMTGAIECFRRAVALAPADSIAHGNLVYSLTFVAADAAPVLAEARRWNERHAAPLQPKARAHRNDRTPGRRLRVGYVAGDFREHCQSLFTVPLFTHHDRDAVEIFAYSSVERPDALTARLRGLAGTWREVRHLNDEELAALIRRDEVDVLVDLEMQMSNGRPLVFARKPAPVQIAWLAYPSTTGMDAIDAVFSDPRLAPPGAERDYAERLVRLPDTFWCYDPLTDGPAAGGLPAGPSGPVTFGCLNAPYKITEHTLRLWCGVLRSVPNSRLVVLGPTGRHQGDFLARFASAGIDPARVTVQGFLPRTEYLESYRRIDLALDTFPYNGHTTSLDAYWMGVPVVTRVGPAAVGRAGLSQLHHLGLLDLAADSDEGFVTQAVALAHDRPRLADLRQDLRARMQKSPLMDAPRFARGVESAYRALWREWCAS